MPPRHLRHTGRKPNPYGLWWNATPIGLCSTRTPRTAGHRSGSPATHRRTLPLAGWFGHDPVGWYGLVCPAHVPAVDLARLHQPGPDSPPDNVPRWPVLCLPCLAPLHGRFCVGTAPVNHSPHRRENVLTYHAWLAHRLLPSFGTLSETPTRHRPAGPETRWPCR